MARIDRIDPIAALWRVFRQPWLLITLGSLAVLLIVGALVVPQVPPEIAFDVSSSTRWLISTSAEYGAIGQLMLNIGLFDVIHSLLLRIIFGLIALVLAVHFAYLLGELFLARRLNDLVTQTTETVEEPLIYASPSSLFQTRHILWENSSNIVQQIEEHLSKNFTKIERHEVELPSADADEEDAETEAESTTVTQQRILAREDLLPRILRPLLMLGLLTALIPLWLIMTAGWELYPPPLAPGQQITFESQGLDLRYISPSPVVVEGPGQQSAYPPPRTLEVRLGEEITTLPIPSNDDVENGDTANTKASTQINQVDIDVFLGPPGLVISTIDGQDGLVLPESSEQMASVGLVFPGVGNEKDVLLPLQGRALRIVRNDNENQIGYLIELIDRNGNPIGDTKQIDGSGSTTVDLRTAETAIRFDPVPGIIVEAKYFPGLWLIFVALGLVLIGAIGYWKRTGYALLQISPWRRESIIAIAQSDKEGIIAAVQEIIAAEEAAPQEDLLQE